ncbi:transketolase [Otariodibacter sp.]|uniref:transketolase n=1 Tax=Otariodibacter sp. TaxID=3030919 RepID=UPI00260C1DCE|nr:transketolase [Otariodibacter sp.]
MNTDLKKFANQIRIEILKSLSHLGFGHFGGSLSIVEILAVLYGDVMKIDPKNPLWEERDYFVLSKGHAGPALYATLALKGYFPVEQLLTLNKNGTKLPSHPDRINTIGVDATTGSLGQGISIATGIALSHSLRNMPNKTFCIVGDGELNEGQCWEAFQFIAHHNLKNLCVIVDYNKQQLDGNLTDIINPFNLENKFSSFGFKVELIKGDDIDKLHQALSHSTEGDKPLVVILDSIKGQGVPYLESLPNCHHLRLTDDIRHKIDAEIQALEVKNASL